MLVKIYQNKNINIDTDIFDNNISIKNKIALKLDTLPKYIFKHDVKWINLKDIVNKNDIGEIAKLLSNNTNQDFEKGLNDSFLFLENRDLSSEYDSGYQYLSSIREKIITLLSVKLLSDYEQIQVEYYISILKDSYKDIFPDYWTNKKLENYFENILKIIKDDKLEKERFQKKFEKDSITIVQEDLPKFSKLKPVQQRRILTFDTEYYNDIMYYFNKIKLTGDVVFASINNIYKLHSNFNSILQDMVKSKNCKNKEEVIKKIISKTREDCILLKYKTNDNGYKSAYIFIENYELKLVYNNLDNYNDKIVSMWDIKKIKKTDIEYIKAKFQILDKNFNKEIFSYLSMNDPLFSKYIRIDDFQNPVKIKSNYTVYYYDPEIKMTKKSIICGMDLKSFKDFDYIQNKGQITIFMTNIDNNININIRRSPGIKAITDFQKIFQNLYSYYEQNIQKIEYIYINHYGIDIKKSIIEKEEESDEQDLLKRFPEIFARGYRTNCTPIKRPHVLKKGEIKNYKNIYERELEKMMEKDNWDKLSEKKRNDIKLRILKILKFPASLQDEKRMIKGDFPSDDNFEIVIDGKTVKSNWYVCDKMNSSNIIPADKKNLYPRLSTNRGKNKSVVPLVPCCMAKIYGKKRNIKSGKIQSSELKGNKLLSKGAKGHLPKDLQNLFNYLDPLHTYHRYGVDDNSNSVLKILNKVFKKKYNRRSLLDYNLGIAKQENYDMSISQIRKYIESDEYLDPKRVVRLLEVKYNCKIYIFNLSKPVTRHDKIKEIPMLIVPRHFPESNYCTYNNNEKIVIIFEHYGNDIRPYPNCELIFRTDYNNYNSEYYFPYNDLISKNLNKYFNLVNLSYSGNMKNTPIFNFNIPDIKGQIIDKYGKCRVLLLKNSITIITQPIPPLNLPVFENFENLDYNEVLQYLKQSKIFLRYGPNIVDKKICGFNCDYNNIELFFPCKIKEIDSEVESHIFYCNIDDDDLKDFDNKRKIAKYLNAYCKYLYSIIGDNDLENFCAENMIINPSHKYNPNTEPFLTDNNSYIQNNKLILISDELKSKLKYSLKMSLERDTNIISTYKDRKLIYKYFEDVSDFTTYKNQIILTGDILKYFQNDFDHTLQDSIVDNTIIPYFVLKDNICLYQNSYSEISKEYIEKEWNNGKGYNDFLIAKLQQEYLENDNDKLLELVEDEKLLTHILTDDRNEPKYVSKLEL